MTTFTLHRGIAIPRANSERVVANIQATGMSGSEGRWRFQLPAIADVRRELDRFYAKPDLTRDDFFAAAPFNGLCAGGRPSDAAYYALRHNSCADRNDQPLAIEFTADIVDVYVDPRDFLCTAFQLWDRASEGHKEWQSKVLRELFGSAVTRYFAAACRSTDQTYRIAMCNLAAFDPEVVKAHFANTKVIGGRYGTRFSSAFFVKAPVDPGRINRVYVPSSGDEARVHISLQDFLEGPGA